MKNKIQANLLLAPSAIKNPQNESKNDKKQAN